MIMVVDCVGNGSGGHGGQTRSIKVLLWRASPANLRVINAMILGGERSRTQVSDLAPANFWRARSSAKRSRITVGAVVRWGILATFAALAFLFASTSQAHANTDDESGLGGTLSRIGRTATSTVKSTTTTVTSTTKVVTRTTTSVVTKTTTAVKTVTGTSSSTVVKPVEKAVTSTTGTVRNTAKAATSTTTAVTKKAAPVPAAVSRVTAGAEKVVPGKAGSAIRNARVGSTVRAVTNSVNPLLDSATGTRDRQGLVGKVVTTLTDAVGNAVPALDAVVSPVGATVDIVVRDLGTTTSDIVDDTVTVVDEVDDIVQSLPPNGGATPAVPALPVAPTLPVVPTVPDGTDGSDPDAVTAPQTKTPSHPAASVTVPATADAVDAGHRMVAQPGHTVSERVIVPVSSASVTDGQAGNDGLVASGVTSLLGASAAGSDLVPSQLGYLSRVGWLASFQSERFLNVGVKGFTLATQPGCSPD